MEFKGTQGKWHFEESTIIAEDGFSVCEVDSVYRIDPFWGEKGAKHWNENGFHKQIDQKEADANAQLIACAPEMLEELKDIRMALMACNNPNDYSIIDSIEKLIKKATKL